MNQQTILVLGASGLIGRFVTDDLRAQGFRAVGVARSLSAAQKMSALDLKLPILSLDAAALTQLFGEHAVDVVVNCLGVLQDGPGSDTNAVHRDFVARLLQAIAGSGRAIRLVHVSIPGTAAADRTAFATTKREAERLIAAPGIPHAILRPGFVVAPSAYGGSAMLRALAAFPLDLPAKEMATPFQSVAIEDISATIAWLAARDPDDALAAFWLVSGFIALFVSYRAAAGILTAHNFPPALVDPITIGTSLMDISIGVLIAVRRTAALGLVAGIMASIGYMVGAAILTPDLWIEPLGALVKTGPAIVLMLVALLMLDNR